MNTTAPAATAQPQRNTLITNTTVIDPVAENPSPGATDILVIEGKIAAVQPGLSQDERAHGAEIVDGSNWLALPGLVNAHYHSHDALLKGMFDVMSLEKWAFRALPRFFPPRTDRELRLRTLVGAAECLRSGITTVQDMLSLWPLTAHQARIVRSAYEEAGLRVVMGIQLADVGPLDTVPFLAEELNEELQTLAKGPPAPHGMSDPMFELESILLTSPSREGDRVTWAVCPSSPERCSRDLMLQMRDMAFKHQLRLFSHIAISRTEAVGARSIFAATSGSPVRYLQALGLLGPHLTLAHGVWLDAADRKILADTRTRMVLNPMSNLKTRNGIARFQDYQREGVIFGLGCDNCSCSDAQNMFQAMKFATLLSGVNSHEDDGLNAGDAIHAATVGGAYALGLENEIGRIEPGYQADITFIDKQDLSYKPLNHAKRQLVYGESGRGVDSVMVQGQFLLRDGRLLSVDTAALDAELEQVMPDVRRHAAEAAARASALDDAISRVEERCRSVDVGMRRFASNE